MGETISRDETEDTWSNHKISKYRDTTTLNLPLLQYILGQKYIFWIWSSKVNKGTNYRIVKDVWSDNTKKVKVREYFFKSSALF